MSSPGGPTVQQTEGSDVENFLDTKAGTEESTVVNLVVPIVATVVTLFRLCERMHQRRLWLDDAWAATAMVLNIVFFVIDWLYLHNYGNAIIVFLPERISLTLYDCSSIFPSYKCGTVLHVREVLSTQHDLCTQK